MPVYQKELEKKLEPTMNMNILELNEFNNMITEGIRTVTTKIFSKPTNLGHIRIQPETLQLMELERKTSRDTSD